MTANTSNNLHQSNRRICAWSFQGWLRDLLRVKDGITNYYLVGEIDVQALRRFQSSYRSLVKPFKPVLDRFEIDFGRKVFPAGEKE